MSETSQTPSVKLKRPILAIVACRRDRLHHQLDATACIARRGEAPLVSDQRGVAAELLLDDLLEVVVALGADLVRVRE